MSALDSTPLATSRPPCFSPSSLAWPQAASLGVRPLAIDSQWAENVSLRINTSSVDVCFTPIVSGAHNLSVSVDAPVHSSLGASPLLFLVTPGPFDPASCVVTGAIAGGIPGYDLPIHVVAMDTHGNQRPSALGDSFYLRLSTDAMSDASVPPVDLSSFTPILAAASTDASFFATYAFNRSGDAGALYLNVVALVGTGPGLLFHVSGSPFLVYRGRSLLPAAAQISFGTAESLPSFGADAASAVSLQLLQSDGSAYTQPTTLLAAAVVPHAGDSALQGNVSSPHLAGTVADLTYVGSGAYSLFYGCDAALSGACSAGGLANLVVELGGVRVPLFSPGARADAALSVVAAAGHAGGCSLTVNSTCIVSGDAMEARVSMALVTGATILSSSNASLLAVSWLGQSLAPRAADSSGLAFDVTPLSSGPLLVCIGVTVALGLGGAGSSSSSRYSCADANVTNVTVLPNPNAVYEMMLGVEGGIEVVAGDAFGLRLALYDPVSVLANPPPVVVALLRHCVPPDLWACAALPVSSDLCEVANLTMLSSTTLTAGVLEYVATIGTGTATVAGCHWVSCPERLVATNFLCQESPPPPPRFLQATILVNGFPQQSPSGLSTPIVIMPRVVASVLFAAVGAYGAPLVMLPASGSMTTADALIVYVLAHDTFGNGVPLSRIANFSVTLDLTACSYSSPRGNLAFSNGSQASQLDWTSSGNVANFTAVAVCRAPASGPASFALSTVVRHANGSLAASASLPVTVTGNVGVVTPLVPDLKALVASTPLTLAASSAFGSLPVIAVTSWGSSTTGSSPAVAGGLVFLSFAVVGPMSTPVLTSQLDPTTVLSVLDGSSPAPCQLAGAQWSPCIGASCSNNYTLSAACSFGSVGTHALFLTWSSGGIIQGSSAAITVSVGSGALSISATSSSVVVGASTVTVAVNASDASANNIPAPACSGSGTCGVLAIACLIPADSAAMLLCSNMTALNVNGFLRLSATLSTPSLASGVAAVVVLQQSPQVSNSSVPNSTIVLAGPVLPTPPTVTVSAMLPAARAGFCVLAALVNQPIVVLSPSSYVASATVLLTDAALGTVLATATPVCGSVWCTFSVPTSWLSTPFVKLRFLNDSGPDLSSALSCGACIFKAPTNVSLSPSNSHVDASAMPLSSVLTTTDTPYGILTLPSFTLTPVLVDSNGDSVVSESIAFEATLNATSDTGILGFYATYSRSRQMCDVWWSAYVPSAWRSAVVRRMKQISPPPPFPS